MVTVQLPTQPSLRRLRQFAIRPKRKLGQNFLIDSNILTVIGRLAELDNKDVVLEIGGGLGVLSEYISTLVDHLHVVEIDHNLEPALRDALDSSPNATLHMADAMKIDLAALDPQPTKVVANLPYSIAASSILRTIFELPGVQLWLTMTQREVGQRLASAPGGSNYAVPSVLAQLACRVEVVRSVSRTVFHPVPNADSVLVLLERYGPAPSSSLQRLIHASFMHRRKALASSLALAPNVPADIRRHAHEALAALELPPNARAQQLSPENFRALDEQLTERVGRPLWQQKEEA